MSREQRLYEEFHRDTARLIATVPTLFTEPSREHEPLVAFDHSVVLVTAGTAPLTVARLFRAVAGFVTDAVSLVAPGPVQRVMEFMHLRGILLLALKAMALAHERWVRRQTKGGRRSCPPALCLSSMGYFTCLQIFLRHRRRAHFPADLVHLIRSFAPTRGRFVLDRSAVLDAEVDEGVLMDHPQWGGRYRLPEYCADLVAFYRMTEPRRRHVEGLYASVLALHQPRMQGLLGLQEARRCLLSTLPCCEEPLRELLSSIGLARIEGETRDERGRTLPLPPGSATTVGPPPWLTARTLPPRLGRTMATGLLQILVDRHTTIERETDEIRSVCLELAAWVGRCAGDACDCLLRDPRGPLAGGVLVDGIAGALVVRSGRGRNVFDTARLPCAVAPLRLAVGNALEQREQRKRNAEGHRDKRKQRDANGEERGEKRVPRVP